MYATRFSGSEHFPRRRSQSYWYQNPTSSICRQPSPVVTPHCEGYSRTSAQLLFRGPPATRTLQQNQDSVTTADLIARKFGSVLYCKPMNTETFSVRLDRSAKTRLQKLAKSTGRSRALRACVPSPLWSRLSSRHSRRHRGNCRSWSESITRRSLVEPAGIEVDCFWSLLSRKPCKKRYRFEHRRWYRSRLLSNRRGRSYQRTCLEGSRNGGLTSPAGAICRACHPAWHH